MILWSRSKVKKCLQVAHRSLGDHRTGMHVGVRGGKISKFVWVALTLENGSQGKYRGKLTPENHAHLWTWEKKKGNLLLVFLALPEKSHHTHHSGHGVSNSNGFGCDHFFFKSSQTHHTRVTFQNATLAPWYPSVSFTQKVLNRTVTEFLVKFD